MTTPRTRPAPETVTYRPRRLRLTAISFSLSLCAASALGWMLLPPDLRASFTTSQRVTLVLILLGLLAILATIAASSVRVVADGLRVRNGLRTHQVRWEEIHAILLRRGDPWAVALIKPDDRPFEVDLDAEKRQLMGIQASDGAGASAAVEDLRRRLRDHRARTG